MKTNFVTNFLLFCSGASKECLCKSPESEVNQFSIIGFIILLTSVFAMLSGGYALYTVFQSSESAVVYASLFGILWGLIIFNIDRYTVSTLVKTDSKLTNFVRATPRLILAIAIGITIAHPLKLKLFESEINEYLYDSLEIRKAEIEKNYEKSLKEVNDSYTQEYDIISSAAAGTTSNTIQKDTEERDKLRMLKLQYQKRVDEAMKAYVSECDGSGGSFKRGDGPECKRKKGIYRDIKREYDNIAANFDKKIAQIDERIEASIQSLKNEKTKRQTQLEKLEKQHATKLDELATAKTEKLKGTKSNFSSSFLSRSTALYELLSKNEYVKWMGFFIMFLFIMVEASPVLSKLFASIGPYDILINAELLEAKENAKQLLHEHDNNEHHRKLDRYERELNDRVKKEEQDIEMHLTRHKNKVLKERLDTTSKKWAKKKFDKAKLLNKFEQLYENDIKRFFEQQQHRSEVRPMPDQTPRTDSSDPVEVTDNFNKIQKILTAFMLIVVWVAIFIFLKQADQVMIEAAIKASLACIGLFSMYRKIFGTALFKFN